MSKDSTNMNGVVKNNLKTKEICQGLSVKRGLDGHWLNFKSGGKYACIHVENTFKYEIAYDAIMNWVTEVLNS